MSDPATMATRAGKIMPSSNMNLSRVQQWLVGLAFTAAAVTISFVWLDRPIAFFAHEHLAQYRLFAQLTKIPEWFARLAILAFVVLGVRILGGRPVPTSDA